MRATAVQSLAGTPRPLQLLLAAVIVVPLALFAVAATLNYRWAFEEARAQLARTADTVDEHALKVFETNELILDRVAERTANLEWSEIEGSREIHEYLKQLAQQVPHIAAVGLIGPDRRFLNSSLVFPHPTVFANRHDFIILPREQDDDILISDVSLGVTSRQPQFLVARYKPHTPHLPDADLIFVSIRPEYFHRYYAEAFEDQGYSVTIVRADGVFLARYPALPLDTVLSPESGFRKSIAVSPARGSYSTFSEVDQRERLFAYRKLGNYPLYVAVGLDRDRVVGTWRRKMASHLVFGVPATLGLIVITLLVVSRTARAHSLLQQANEESVRRERLEASLHQAQKMEAVGQLTGGVAHDFNNLLTAIMGSLEMILRAADGHDQQVRQYAAAAMRASERGARLTQQLLAFSRRQILRPEIVDVNRLLREFETLMQRAVGESIDFALVLDPKVDRCRIDPAQCQSAILNLVVNARDATPAGGRVIIETQSTMVRPETEPVELKPGRYVTISVSDTGSGMTPQVRAQAFDPFFTTKGVGKGSGLGLSQVYGFAKQSGGHVSVESAPGHGTTVRLHLPSAESPEETRDARSEGERRHTRKQGRVLVVEDDEAVLETAKAVIDELGYTAVAARNAVEALTILRRGEPIDVLFSDVVMPGGMSGIALAHEARRLRQDINVLLTSGYDPSVDESQATDGFALLSKPYGQSELADKLASLLGQR